MRNLEDGTEEKLTLPKSNVLHYSLTNGFWFCIRPSGTEPKIKIYYGVSANSLSDADCCLDELKNNVIGVIKPLLE
jgi:phosphoglucomutase